MNVFNKFNHNKIISWFYANNKNGVYNMLNVFRRNIFKKIKK